MNKNRLIFNSMLCWAFLWFCVLANAYEPNVPYSPEPVESDFASAIITDLTFGPFHSSLLWNKSDSVLGIPNNSDKDDDQDNSTPCFREINLCWSAWYRGSDDPCVIDTPYNSAIARDNGCGLKQGGQIVVEFDHPVANDKNNPYGIDFIVHGNSAWFAEDGRSLPNTNMEYHNILRDVPLEDMLAGAEPLTVSVAQSLDGQWYTYSNGPFADFLYPTNCWFWDWEQHNWMKRQTSWLRPVDPNLCASDFAGKSVAKAIDLYNGSAGGTGFDLSESPFEWIKYVKITDPNGNQGEITGIVDVAACGDYRHPFPAGDVNFDCRVNLLDFAQLAENWFKCDTPQTLPGDIAGEDGCVDQFDLIKVADSWLDCTWDCQTN